MCIVTIEAIRSVEREKTAVAERRVTRSLPHDTVSRGADQAEVPADRNASGHRNVHAAAHLPSAGVTFAALEHASSRKHVTGETLSVG